MGEVQTDQRAEADARAEFWKGYAAGLADRASPRNPRGWIFLALVAHCLLTWAFAIAVVIWLF